MIPGIPEMPIRCFGRHPPTRSPVEQTVHQKIRFIHIFQCPSILAQRCRQLEQEKQTIKKDLEESLQEAGAAREELAAVRQAQVEAYMKRKPFPKRQGTVELKDAILRL